MPGHPHDPPFPAALPTPEPILPSIEALVRQRASELVPTPKPRRRLVLASSVGSLAVAACCAVLIMVLGSSSSSGWLSPQRAVAAMADSLESDGILHWVRRGQFADRRASLDRPGMEVIEQWIDLSTWNAHQVTRKAQGAAGESNTAETWQTGDALWVRLDGPEGQSTGLKKFAVPPVDHPEDRAGSDLSVLLGRAEQGQVSVSEAGEHDGVPLVVIADRTDRHVRRFWITREERPRVVRSSTEMPARDSQPAVTLTEETVTWEILPRTDDNLARVEPPTDARKVP